MINILIVDDDINFLKKIINIINIQKNDTKVYSIATDIEESITIINNNTDIDIIIYRNINKYNIMSLNNIKNSYNYYKSIIIFSNTEIELPFNKTLNDMIYNFSYNMDEETIIQQIYNLVNHKHKLKRNKEIRKAILNELLFLGYNISHKGTNLLIDAIQYAIENKIYNIKSLKDDIYSVIAIKNNETIQNVKCSISRETKEMYLCCDMKKLQDYFLYEKDHKPNVKTVITTVINKIIFSTE